MIREYLFIGGPWHGEIHGVEGVDIVTVPVPIGAARDVATGVPIIGKTVQYIRRQLGIMTPRGGAARDLYVDADLGPEQAHQALAELLVTLWVMEAPDRLQHGA